MHIPLWTAILYAAQCNAAPVSLKSIVDHETSAHLSARTNAADICLPYQLQATVPSCALSCLQSFILDNYYDHTCTSTADLDFVCTSRTRSGLTIGEGSLQCVISNCLGADIETQSGYSICDGIPEALPNMAGTITATINSITTLSASTGGSISATTDTPATTTSPDASLTALTSNPMAPPPSPSSITVASPSLASSTTFTTTASSTSSISASISETATPSSSQSTVSSRTVARSSSTIASAGDLTQASDQPSATSASSTSGATAAAATGNMPKPGLSTSAIAGIATASIVAMTLLLGYLAYLFIVKRKEKRRRQSQRFSAFFPPTSDDSTDHGQPEPADNSQTGAVTSTARRFYAGETKQQKRETFWRRSALPPTDIGVAVATNTLISPEEGFEKNTSNANIKGIPWPPSAPETRFQRKELGPEESRWSVATSFGEDAEAHNQDVPILGSPKARSSARSISTVGKVEKPAPLRLSKVKPRAETPPSAKILLTPVYDNGNFEPIIRQVFDEPMPTGFAPVTQVSQEAQAPNFSRRQPSLIRTSQEEPGPLTVQLRQQNPTGRFPVRITSADRKQSEMSIGSISVYTDIEEDDTPENEDDKQLGRQPTVPSEGRQPLRDLQWPQIPRPAAQSKQAGEVHSPRAAVMIRKVNSSDDVKFPEPIHSGRDQQVKQGSSFLRTNTSSFSEITSNSSASPVFPTPPTRSYAQTNARGDLTRQISKAYNAATQSTTAVSPARSSHRYTSSQTYRPAPDIIRPGQTYQGIQRLGTGRPLAQRLQAPGIVPRPPVMGSASRAKVTPTTSRSGDLYFTVRGMDDPFVR